jgi:hypothetical protein
MSWFWMGSRRNCRILSRSSCLPHLHLKQRQSDGFRQQWSSRHFVHKVDAEDGTFKSTTVADVGAWYRTTEIMKDGAEIMKDDEDDSAEPQ